MSRNNLFGMALSMIGFTAFVVVLFCRPRPAPITHNCAEAHPWTAVCPTAEHWNEHNGPTK
jgi:hypothetical protein